MSFTSVAGAAFLLLVGIGFIGAALLGWLRRHEPDRRTRTLGVVVDLVVGIVAVADATLSVVDNPIRAVLWCIGSSLLAAAMVLLIVRYSHPLPRRDGPATGFPRRR